MNNNTILQTLLKEKADITAKDRHGRSALHYVLHCRAYQDAERIEVVKVLLEQNIGVETKDMKRPLHIAVNVG